MKEDYQNALLQQLNRKTRTQPMNQSPALPPRQRMTSTCEVDNVTSTAHFSTAYQRKSQESGQCSSLESQPSTSSSKFGIPDLPQKESMLCIPEYEQPDNEMFPSPVFDKKGSPEPLSPTDVHFSMQRNNNILQPGNKNLDHLPPLPSCASSRFVQDADIRETIYDLVERLNKESEDPCNGQGKKVRQQLQGLLSTIAGLIGEDASGSNSTNSTSDNTEVDYTDQLDSK